MISITEGVTPAQLSMEALDSTGSNWDLLPLHKYQYSHNIEQQIRHKNNKCAFIYYRIKKKKSPVNIPNLLKLNNPARLTPKSLKYH